MIQTLGHTHCPVCHTASREFSSYLAFVDCDSLQKYLSMRHSYRLASSRSRVGVADFRHPRRNVCACRYLRLPVGFYRRVADSWVGAEGWEDEIVISVTVCVAREVAQPCRQPVVAPVAGYEERDPIAA